MSKLSGNVLITGANGFIGLHAVDQALKLTDLKVKAVVRSEKSAQEVKKAFGNEIKNGRVEIAFVPKMEEEGAYDEVIQGIDYVIHLASPLPNADFSPETVGDVYLRPAIRGVERLLEASAKTTSVKKVVLTSSIAAIAGQKFKGLDETDWRDTDYERALKSASNFDAYTASKTLAEKAAWEFLEKNSPSFTLTALNPTFIFGPTLVPSEISGTNGMAWNSMTKDKSDLFTVGCVDVRDTAKAHVTALINKEVTDGKRYIIHSETPSPSQMIDIAHRNFPDQKDLWAKPVPVEPLGPEAPVCSYTNESLKRSSKDLGVEFRPVEESVVDFVKGFFEYQAHVKSNA